MADAREPTSVTGTSIALPRNMQAPVARPTHRTDVAGVRFTGWTLDSRGLTSPRLPIAKSKRLAATKFPLKTLNSESNAAARIMLTIQREPIAGWKETAVMNGGPTGSGQGGTN